MQAAWPSRLALVPDGIWRIIGILDMEMQDILLTLLIVCRFVRPTYSISPANVTK